MSGYSYEFAVSSLGEITEILGRFGVETALLKLLPKNANDKNQIYIASDFGVLYELFALNFDERGMSESVTKTRSTPGKRIQEAVFASFGWIRPDGVVTPARRVKAIIYPQYPEARISGLAAIDNTMPHTLSVAFTKTATDIKRLLVLGKKPGGSCVAMVVYPVSAELENEFDALPGFEKARACKRLDIDQGHEKRLERELAAVLGRPLPGCRLDAQGKTIPFKGTQVCGYTLEHALDITPNADSHGDIYGIELKTHTQRKVTLFTPEPDLGLYAEDFIGFMKTYGYKDGNGDYRLTGIHRANEMCKASELTLRVIEHEVRDGKWCRIPYNPLTALSAKIDTVEVILEDKEGNVAAGWSLERLMNCWGAKHNEAVYIEAEKRAMRDEARLAEGYVYEVEFGRRVMWCKETSAERMLSAINDGVIFLDPAPKYCESDPGKSKRRAQWRVNDIHKAAASLYSSIKFKNLV